MARKIPPLNTSVLIELFRDLELPVALQFRLWRGHSYEAGRGSRWNLT